MLSELYQQSLTSKILVPQQQLIETTNTLNLFYKTLNLDPKEDSRYANQRNLWKHHNPNNTVDKPSLDISKCFSTKSFSISKEKVITSEGKEKLKYSGKESLTDIRHMLKLEANLYKHCGYPQIVTPNHFQSTRASAFYVKKETDSTTAWKIYNNAYRDTENSPFRKATFDAIGYRLYILDSDIQQASEDILNKSRYRENIALLVESSPGKHHTYAFADKIYTDPKLIKTRETLITKANNIYFQHLYHLFTHDRASYLITKIIDAINAPYSDKTLDQLEALSPYAIPPYIASHMFPNPAFTTNSQQDFDQFIESYKHLNSLSSSDPVITDPLRCFQLPGFINPKSNFRARIVYANPDAIPLSPAKALAIPNPNKIIIPVTTDIPVTKPKKLKVKVKPQLNRTNLFAKLPTTPTTFIQALEAMDLIPQANDLLGESIYEAQDITSHRNALILLLNTRLHRLFQNKHSPEAQATVEAWITNYYSTLTSKDLAKSDGIEKSINEFRLLLDHDFNSPYTQNLESLKSLKNLKPDLVFDPIVANIICDGLLTTIPAKGIKAVKSLRFMTEHCLDANQNLKDRVTRMPFNSFHSFTLRFQLPSRKLKSLGRYQEKLAPLYAHGILLKEKSYKAPNIAKHKFDTYCKSYELVLPRSVIIQLSEHFKTEEAKKPNSLKPVLNRFKSIFNSEVPGVQSYSDLLNAGANGGSAEEGKRDKGVLGLGDMRIVGDQVVSGVEKTEVTRLNGIEGLSTRFAGEIQGKKGVREIKEIKAILGGIYTFGVCFTGCRGLEFIDSLPQAPPGTYG